MELSERSKKELREKIIRLVNAVPNGQRLHLDKQLLEDLLFETVTLDEKQGIIVKLPVWSGEFLRKIDLSEVDFTNVSWDILGCEEDEVEFIINSGPWAIYDKSVLEKISKIRKDMEKSLLKSQTGYIVDYSWTNANVDLAKSFEAIHEKWINISECNFTGVDLSQLDLTGITNLYLSHSSIGETNLSIPSNCIISGCKSSLKGINLSSRTIHARSYFDTFEAGDFPYCNLCNTGINIELSDTDLKNGKYKYAIYLAMIHCWFGCHLNGQEILPPAEKPAVDDLNPSEPIEQDLIDDILSDLQDQVRSLKRLLK